MQTWTVLYYKANHEMKINKNTAKLQYKTYYTDTDPIENIPK